MWQILCSISQPCLWRIVGNGKYSITQKGKKWCGEKDRDRQRIRRREEDWERDHKGRAEAARTRTAATWACGLLGPGPGVGGPPAGLSDEPRGLFWGLAHRLPWLVLVLYSREFWSPEKQVGEMMSRWRPCVLRSDQGGSSLLTNCLTGHFLNA